MTQVTSLPLLALVRQTHADFYSQPLNPNDTAARLAWSYLNTNDIARIGSMLVSTIQSLCGGIFYELDGGWVFDSPLDSAPTPISINIKIFIEAITLDQMNYVQENTP